MRVASLQALACDPQLTSSNRLSDFADCFKPQVTTLGSETWASEGKARGPWAPLDFENFNKKLFFRNFEWEKTNFTTFAPLGKILEKSLSGPPGTNPSYAHVQK